MASCKVWKLAVGLFRGLALFSARPWPEGKAFGGGFEGWNWELCMLCEMCGSFVYRVDGV